VAIFSYYTRNMGISSTLGFVSVSFPFRAFISALRFIMRAETSDRGGGKLSRISEDMRVFVRWGLCLGFERWREGRGRVVRGGGRVGGEGRRYFRAAVEAGAVLVVVAVACELRAVCRTCVTVASRSSSSSEAVSSSSAVAEAPTTCLSTATSGPVSKIFGLETGACGFEKPAAALVFDITPCNPVKDICCLLELGLVIKPCNVVPAHGASSLATSSSDSSSLPDFGLFAAAFALSCSRADFCFAVFAS